MKHLLLAIFCLAFTASISAQPGFKVDTLVSETWTNNNWRLDTRIVNTYDNDCQLFTSLIQSWNAASSSWVNQALTTYTYTGGDHISVTLSQSWNSGASSWDNLQRTTNTYNGSFQVTITLVEFWLTNAWQSFSRTTNTYDGSGYLITTLGESLFPVQVNSTLTTYTNNPDGTVNQQLEQAWNAGTLAWDNTARNTYTYNADKSVSQEIAEIWNSGTMAWENADRYTYTYDGSGRPLTSLTEVWLASDWVNSELSTNTYDGSGYLINGLDQNWDTGSNLWVNNTQSNLTYDGQGRLFQIVSQIWDTNSSVWGNDTRATLNYTTSCTLPLKLLDFTAALSGKNVLLNWTTVTEINTKYFDIERSKDATRFEKIGSVNASGNSTQKLNYQFTDANAISVGAGKVFYRLKMVDQDGKFTYSKIDFVVLTPDGRSFSIFPNPVKDQLFLVFNGQSNGQGSVRITDQFGKQVYTQQINSQQTGTQLNINVSTLKSGLYYIQVITGDGMKSAKFVKP